MLVETDSPTLTFNDNTSEALQWLLAENARMRAQPWPAPYDQTTHRFHLGDARDLGWIPSESVHLIVTSPPYWTLKKYNDHPDQLGDVSDYETFLAELDLAWAECTRVLAPGGRLCCVVGDVCVPRRKNRGRHWVAPLHADIQVRTRHLGLDNLTPIFWNKISNGATEAAGNGAGYYGKPYQPNGVIKNDVEYVLLLRKGGTYRKPELMQKVLSMLTRAEQRAWFSQIWADVPGASTRNGHPAPYPVEVAYRLIRMFSFAGDTELDPFAGTATTAVAALRAGRNSISNEVDPDYVRASIERVGAEASTLRYAGSTHAAITEDNPS